MKLFKSLSCILVVLFLFSTVNVWAGAATKDAFSDFSLTNFSLNDANNDAAVAAAIAENAVVGSLATTYLFQGSVPKPWNGLIGYIKNGSFIGYKNIDFGADTVNVTAYMKVDKNHDNGYATGSYIEIRLDNKDSAPAARIDLPDKEVWDAKGVNDVSEDGIHWKFNVLTPIEVQSNSSFKISGVHDVYFVFLNSTVKIEDLPNVASDQNPYFCNIDEAYFKKAGAETTAPIGVTTTPIRVTAAPTTAKGSSTPVITTPNTTPNTTPGTTPGITPGNPTLPGTGDTGTIGAVLAMVTAAAFVFGGLHLRKKVK